MIGVVTFRRGAVSVACMAALVACGPTTVPLPPAPSRPPLSPTEAIAVPSATPTASRPPGAPRPGLEIPPPEGPNIHVFEGPGTWVDIFERAYRHPGKSVDRMASLGIRTIYLQTSNFTRPAIRFPGRFGAFIEAAHAKDIVVVGWYLPGLQDVPGDLRKSLAAIGYTSPKGEQMDGFGLDIESAEVRRHKIRSERLINLSRQIRAAVGPTYPLGAITPMPVRLGETVNYWRSFPYPEIAEFYDAILPMNYFTYDVSGGAAAQRYTALGMDLIREGTGDPNFPIHQIGGISGDMTVAEARGFMRAVEEEGAIGWSLYNYSLMPERLWPITV